MKKNDRKPPRRTARKPNVKFSKGPAPGSKRAGGGGGDAGASSAGPSRKKQRTDTNTDGANPPGSPKAGPSGSNKAPAADDPPAAEDEDAAPGAAGANADADGDADDESDTPPQPRVRNTLGIRPKEVSREAKPTQRAFQRVIRAMCGMITQNDILPSAIEARDHYDKRFDKVSDQRAHMRNLVDESRTAVKEAADMASKLIKDAKRVPGPIANDIARISEVHLATVFTMVQKAGLKGFCPDIEGPVHSKYNELHRHLAVSGFQYLSSSYALMGLNVNNHIAQDHNLMCDMYDNFLHGTLAQNTRKERRQPGSLGESLVHTLAFKGRTRVSQARFKTTTRLNLRKPVKRMAFVKEAHSDDDHTPNGRVVRDKPGRNPVCGRFFVEYIDKETEEYRQRNAKRGQKKPQPRQRDDPLLPASGLGRILPPLVPIDFFTPEFYNALTVKERARYANTGVAFPLERYAFNEAHQGWMKMGKAEFMKAYGNEVLALYKVPSAEEMANLSDSDADDHNDEEEPEINLADTEDSEMEVDEELNQ